MEYKDCYLGMRVKAAGELAFRMKNKCFGTVVKMDDNSILVEWDKENDFMHKGPYSLTVEERRFPGKSSCYFCEECEIAPLNRIEKVADALGLYEGQKFYLHDEDGDRLNYGPYMFDGEQFLDCNNDTLSGGEFEALLMNRLTFISDREVQLEGEIKELREKLEDTTEELSEKIRVREEELESIREGE